MPSTQRICSCCGQPVVWDSLEFVGYMDTGADRIELRNCPCGSTISTEAPCFEVAPAMVSVIRQRRTVAKLAPVDLFAAARAKAMAPRLAATRAMGVR